jgi:hypothetical protein
MAVERDAEAGAGRQRDLPSGPIAKCCSVNSQRSGDLLVEYRAACRLCFGGRQYTPQARSIL